MFTSVDKALVALVTSGVYILNNLGVAHIPDSVVTSIVSVAPILVWLIPNKKA